MWRYLRAGAAICLVLTSISQAYAQTPESDDWQLTIAPYAWLTSLDGNITVQGVQGDADAEFFEDILDDLTLAGMVLIDLQKGSWALAGNFVGARLETSNDIVDTTQYSVNLGVGLTYFVLDRPRDPEGGIGFRLGPTLGARYTYLRAELDLGDFRTFDAIEQWVDPLVGIRGALDLSDRFGIAGETDVGGFGIGSDISYNAQIYGLYKTSTFGVPTDLSLGYRVLHQNYDDGDFEYDVTTFGPIIGAAFRF